MFRGYIYGMKFKVVVIGLPIGALYHDVCDFFSDDPDGECGWTTDDCLSLCMAHMLALAHCWVSIFSLVF